jgi:tetratricopeptide (TPR) repeat protein
MEARKLPALGLDNKMKSQARQVAVLCFVLAAITFAVFGQTLTHTFIDFDDNEYVYDNPVVARGLSLKGMVWAFTTIHAFNWHPLTWLSHMLDCQLYGLHPGGHHLTNVLLHIATVIALFLVLRQMTGALWRSAFVAAVFAIHPLRVESVAWVAERKDVLSGLFFMLTIGAYVRYARLPWSAARYGLVMLLFAMGLMCKPMLVTLPLVLLLLDYWPLQRVESRKLSGLALEKLPLLALAAASCGVSLLAQCGAVHSGGAYSLPSRLGNALVTCMVYLVQMVYPAGLAVFYPYPHNGLPPWEVALAGTLLAGLSVVAWKQRRTHPWLLMGWVWYLVMLLPVVGLIQVGQQAHADRYTYLPQIGIYVAVTWLVAQWRISRVAGGSLMAGVSAVLMLCAWQQTAYWKDNETLWTHTLACTTRNEVAHYGLGSAFLHKERLDEAIAHYQKALAINPDYPNAKNDLGTALLKKGRADEAIACYQQALQIEPDYVKARNNLGNALLQEGRMEEAITQYQEVLQIKPDFAEACYNLGSILLQMGKADDALTHFQRALQINPNYVDARVDLGSVLLQKGRMDDAIAQFRQALQLNPGCAAAHINLGTALLQKGSAAEAIAHYQQALQTEPANLVGQNNLAWVLATYPEGSLRNGNKAVELARQANTLTGGENPAILHTLAAALAEAGRFAEAVETAQRASRLAETQSNPDLARQLQSEIQLYQMGSPFHSPEQTH